MNRKNAIVVAVLINAGLLSFLFMTAVTKKDEPALPMNFISGQPEPAQPLFGGELEPQAFVPELLIPKVEEKAIAYHLPQEIAPMPVVQPEPTPAIQQFTPTPSSPAKWQEVTVKKGDTLDKIAKATHTTVEELKTHNKLTSSFLRIGQVLRIPPQGNKKTVTAPQQAVAATTTEGEFYTVKPGDTPWTIAMKHHMKVDDLLKLNHLDGAKAKRLKPGDKLRVK